ncbi:hypothetical protein [Listeria booriae]|uniref:hypothetical protein n=1 Tax=Listeria booriae TaxID=1552123 RepID=UPI0016290427|nr:hypothetical protein [Listeria booriae]MBC1358087.1 hypothetical protein [Listeria booriae]
MVQKATREEMNEQFIEDQFFEKGNGILKLKQIVITVLAWIGFFIPFFLVLFPILFMRERVIIFEAFQTVLRMFRILSIFFIILACVIIIIFVWMTYRNNRRYTEVLGKKVTYDEEKVAIRKAAINQFATKRFGDKVSRETQRFTSIPEEKNLDTRTIADIYEEKGVPLQ